MTDYSGYITITAWASDFSRAMCSRPFGMRWLMRWLMGHYAYREFIGMQDALTRNGDYPFGSYELTGMEYHADRLPSDFAKNREPIPLRQAEVEHAPAA